MQPERAALACLLPLERSAVYTWGSTAAERARPFPCDGLVPEPTDALFRAVDVGAPARVLFRGSASCARRPTATTGSTTWAARARGGSRRARAARRRAAGDDINPPIRAPRGVERVTRHPFFVGVALLASAHVLFATRLVGAVFFAGLAALAILGARHQDRKLLARRGAPYAGYLAVTSAVPFAAIVARRQRLAWREIPPRGLVLGLAVAAALRAVHASIFAHGGAWVIGVVLAGAALSAGRAWRRAQRVAGMLPGAAAAS